MGTLGGTRTTVAAALCAMLLLAGCGDDEPAETGPTPTGSPTESSSPSEEPSETAPAVEPASGKQVRMPAFTVTLPAGWPVGGAGGGPYADIVLEPSGDDLGGSIGLAAFPTGERSLEEEAREQTGGKRQPDVEIAGEPAYVFTRPQPGPVTSVTYGLNRDGRSVRIEFALFGGSERERQDLVSSVLATVEWR